MSKQRIVIDTNVLVSAALILGSTAQRALNRTLADHQLLQSVDTLNELKEVLERRKFDKYLSYEDRQRFLKAIVRDSELVRITVTISDCRDPKDNKFLELAFSGLAGVIVSGDKDLLSMSPYRSMQIITPAAFLAESA